MAVPRRRPIIDVEVAATTPNGVLLGTPLRTDVLVDSGADVTMLEASLAGTLGIDLRGCPMEWVQGVGGVKPVWKAIVMMHLCDAWVHVPVAFALQQQPQLLGRDGAFDSLWVAFGHRHGLLLSSVA